MLEWGRQFFGNKRYEQLLTATGTISTRDGTIDISGGGMRTHRVGTRNTGTFPGHTWMTAIFPNGPSRSGTTAARNTLSIPRSRSSSV